MWCSMFSSSAACMSLLRHSCRRQPSVGLPQRLSAAPIDSLRLTAVLRRQHPQQQHQKRRQQQRQVHQSAVRRASSSAFVASSSLATDQGLSTASHRGRRTLATDAKAGASVEAQKQANLQAAKQMQAITSEIVALSSELAKAPEEGLAKNKAALRDAARNAQVAQLKYLTAQLEVLQEDLAGAPAAQSAAAPAAKAGSSGAADDDVQAVIDKENNADPDRPIITSMGNTYRCSICNVLLTQGVSVETHVAGKRHRRARQKAAAGTAAKKQENEKSENAVAVASSVGPVEDETDMAAEFIDDAVDAAAAIAKGPVVAEAAADPKAAELPTADVKSAESARNRKMRLKRQRRRANRQRRWLEAQTKGTAEVLMGGGSKRPEPVLEDLSAYEESAATESLSSGRWWEAVKYNNQELVTVPKVIEPTIIPMPSEIPVPLLASALRPVVTAEGTSHAKNFTQYFKDITHPDDVDFDQIPPFITSSRDKMLEDISKQHGAKFMASTSSSTSLLSQIHFTFSNYKRVSTELFSPEFKNQVRALNLYLGLVLGLFVRVCV